MQYSIWILLEGKAQETLKKIVNQLSIKYGGPAFEPHLTLLSPIPGKKEAVIEKANEIAKIVRPFKLTTTNVDYGETYFRSVFIRVNTSKPLIDAAMFARTLFGINSIFVSHISLFYGNVDIKTREEIAKSVKLPNLTFKAEKIVVTPAGGSVSDPKDWHHLAEIPLLF
ncbi:MAG: hypothetical protein AAB875_00970 [Patescibacteria group bacterium]